MQTFHDGWAMFWGALAVGPWPFILGVLTASRLFWWACDGVATQLALPLVRHYWKRLSEH